jgi:hypothetical protein
VACGPPHPLTPSRTASGGEGGQQPPRPGRGAGRPGGCRFLWFPSSCLGTSSLEAPLPSRLPESVTE